MRYRFMATYLGVPYHAGLGPDGTEVTLFSPAPPPEDLISSTAAFSAFPGRTLSSTRLGPRIARAGRLANDTVAHRAEAIRVPRRTCRRPRTA